MTPHSRETLQFQQTNREGSKEPATHTTHTKIATPKKLSNLTLPSFSSSFSSAWCGRNPSASSLSAALFLWLLQWEIHKIISITVTNMQRNGREHVHGIRTEWSWCSAIPVSLVTQSLSSCSERLMCWFSLLLSAPSVAERCRCTLPTAGGDRACPDLLSLKGEGVSARQKVKLMMSAR